MGDCRERDATGLINLHCWLRVDVDVSRDTLCQMLTKEKNRLGTMYNSFEKKANYECMSIWQGYIAALNANLLIQKLYSQEMS